MHSMNKATLVGKVCDMQVKRSKLNRDLITFTVVTSQRYNDADHPSFHNVVVFVKDLVEVARNTLTNGATVFVEGSIKYATYLDQYQIKQRRTQITLCSDTNKLVILEPEKKLKSEDSVCKKSLSLQDIGKMKIDDAENDQDCPF